MTRFLSIGVSCILLPTFLFSAADKPLSPREAAARMSLPKGFHATLFAGEPDVVQPIAFCFDERGRLWVAECLSYPNWTKEKEGKDRIVIFEDRDGKGSFTHRTVFTDNLTNISGINVGFGGVWVCATPNLLYIPFDEGKDKPSGPPRVVLDGWDLSAKHNIFNSLTWGPDGWLYGCNGILSNSVVGKPGTPEKDRVRLNCGVWRYHPTRGTFEVVASGTTNPWGLDFDEFGEAFITNCVIHHLWHVIPGAAFSTNVWPGSQPVYLQPDELVCGPHSLGRWRLDDVARRPRQPRRRRRRPRPCWGHDLPRRQLARALPRRPLHL